MINELKLRAEKEKLLLQLFDTLRDSELDLAKICLDVSMMRATCYMLQIALGGDDEMRKMSKNLDDLYFYINQALSRNSDIVNAIRARTDAKIHGESNKSNERPQ